MGPEARRGVSRVAARAEICRLCQSVAPIAGENLHEDDESSGQKQTRSRRLA